MNVFFYEKRKERLGNLKAIIMEKNGFVYMPLTDTPAYQYLCGSAEKYDSYVSILAEKYGDEMHTRKRLEELLDSIKENGFQADSRILADDKNVILDGHHRAAWLVYTYGQDYEIDVVQLYTLYEDRKWDLFPFEKIKGNSKIVIYGASLVGESYIKQLKYTGYAEVIGLLDRCPEKWNCQKKKREMMQCSAPEMAASGLLQDADYCLLATRNDRNAYDMANIILSTGFPREKIISRCRF
jgi:hypothetical protein